MSPALDRAAAPPLTPKGEPGQMKYNRLDPARLDALLLVLLHVLRNAVGARVLLPQREIVWVKQNPNHLAVHLITTLATLTARGIFPVDRWLAHRVVRYAAATRPELLGKHAPIVYFDGKRDRRHAVVFDWPAVLRFLDEHADCLKPVALPALLDAGSAIASTAAENA